MSPSRKSLAALLFVSLLTGALYLRTITFDFVTYDDGVYVTDNAHVRAGLSWASVRYAFTTGDTGTWQPLALLSHMLDSTLFGMNAGGHHATSAILHMLNTFLLGLALLRMTGVAGPSIFVAAVFGLHPMHVESVAWVSERKDVLSTFFAMLALGAYAEWSETLRKRWLVAAILALALGLLAKPMLVTLPFVLLLLDYWPLRRVHREGRLRCFALLIAEKLGMFALAAAACVTTIVVQRAAQATSAVEALSLTLRLKNAVVAYVGYFEKAFWPDDLLIFYPHPLDKLSALQVVGSACALLAVTAFAWRLRGRSPYLLVGWLWYLGTLLPVIGIVQVGTQAMADRYSYMPMVGLSIMVAWGGRDLAARTGVEAKSSVIVGSCAVLFVLIILTWSRIGIWRNSEALYRSTLATMPDNPVALTGLGSLLVERHQYEEAIPLLEVALRKKHREKEAHYHLGLVYQNTFDFAQAEEHYRAAVEMDPQYSEAWNNLGVTLNVLGKPADALHAFERAVETGPQNKEAATNLIHYLVQLGRTINARNYAEEVAARFPESPEIRAMLESLNASIRKPTP